MKKLITFALARFFNWFKMKSPAAYTIVYSGLLWAQTQLADPAILKEILSGMSGAPAWVVTLIKWAPSIIMGLIAPHTSEKVEEYNQHRALRRNHKKF